MAHTAHSATTDAVRARKVMGGNFFGVEEAIAHIGVTPSGLPIAYPADVPFSEAVLDACKRTHVLVAVLPMSILDIRYTCAGQRLFYEQSWYDRQSFANEKGKTGWQLIRKTPIDGSLSKTWEEQKSLLGKDDEVPSARAVIYTMVGHFRTTGERLFEKVWVRCSDLDSDGDRVRVGLFDSVGLGVDGYWDDGRYSSLGVSASRKPCSSNP